MCYLSLWRISSTFLVVSQILLITDPIAQWRSRLSQPIYKPFLQQSPLFSLTSLIFLQTKIYQTERSLSESWRARSRLEAVLMLPLWLPYSLGQITECYYNGDSTGESSPIVHFKDPDLITNGGQWLDTRRLRSFTWRLQSAPDSAKLKTPLEEEP